MSSSIKYIEETITKFLEKGPSPRHKLVQAMTVTHEKASIARINKVVRGMVEKGLILEEEKTGVLSNPTETQNETSPK